MFVLMSTCITFFCIPIFNMIVYITIYQGKSPLPLLRGDSCVGGQLKEGDYLVWVDADAVFVDHQATLEEVVLEGKDKDLIIGEDMHVGNLVNCGIILVKVSQWSLQLWRQVFRCRRSRSRFLFVHSGYFAGMTQSPFLSSLPCTRCSRPTKNLLPSSTRHQ